ncbi:MAG: ubiquinol-cytochrome C chaperone family protein [Candidatus Mucispirillum faecigallinarum]|nr:ubiquinol-cytochrome C chaperone family protein [Candidatus Mucispirillum faecigallinarum]
MAYDADLTDLFKKCTNEDLNTIVEYITQKGSLTESLTTSEEYKQHAPNHTEYIGKIIDEIQRFGGDAIANMFRGKGVKYREITEDVAKHFKIKYNDNMSTSEIEQDIIATVIKQAWEKMKEDDRIAILRDANVDINSLDEETKKILIKGDFSLLKGVVLSTVFMQILIKVTGFKAYQISVIVANMVAKAVLGRGLALAGNAALVRSLAVFTGPIGWIITGLLTAPLITGPAYRVTIPCVLHIAMLREKYS